MSVVCCVCVCVCVYASLIPQAVPTTSIYFQYEIRQGEGWEIWSCAVPSGRHVVDTRRVVLNEESQRLSCTVHPKAACQNIRKVADRYCSLFTMPGTDRRKTGIIKGWAPPSMCLPSVYLMSLHMTRSPRPSPAISSWKR